MTSKNRGAEWGDVLACWLEKLSIMDKSSQQSKAISLNVFPLFALQQNFYLDPKGTNGF